MVPDVTLVTRHFPAVYGGAVFFLSSDGESVNSVSIHVVVHRQAIGFCLFKRMLKTNTHLLWFWIGCKYHQSVHQRQCSYLEVKCHTKILFNGSLKKSFLIHYVLVKVKTGAHFVLKWLYKNEKSALIVMHCSIQNMV